MRDDGAAVAGVEARVGVTARAGALVLSVATAVLSSGPELAAALALSWFLALAIHPAAFRVLRRPALWAMLALLAVPPLAMTTPRDLLLPLGLAVSSEAATVTSAMMARSLMIVVAAAGFASTVSVRALTDLLEIAGLRGLGFSLGVALHALPVARQTWSTSASALRLRGGFRQAPLRDAALLGMTVVGNALRHADEVVEAAQARGFAPERRRGTPPALWRSDLLWLGLWTLAAATLVAL